MNHNIKKALRKHNLIFKDCQAFKRHLKTTNDIPEIIMINNILFTQDYYDREGKLITYGNLKKGKTLSLKTTDRYENGLEGIKVEMYNMMSYRPDIIYLQ